MALESATYISDLVITNPTGADSKSTSDDHHRLIKSTLKTTFPNVTGAVTVTQSQLNDVVNKAPIASPTFTGVPSAPTATPATATTQLASTAFVQAAIAGVNAQAAAVVSVVAGTTQTAVAGSHYILTNVAATTVTLPATPASGDTVWVTWTNTLTTNVIARNGQTIMGLSEDMTLDASTNGTVQLRFVSSSWRLI